MTEQEPFDWNDFYILGNSYLTTINPAKKELELVDSIIVPFVTHEI